MAYIAASAEGKSDEGRASVIFKEATGEEFEEFLCADLPDWVDGDPLLNNPVKYGLYNDPFLGLFDYHLQEGKSTFFAESAKKLTEISRKSEYGYVFDTLAKLCSVMELKYDLGIVTRRAYKALQEIGTLREKSCRLCGRKDKKN